MKLFIFSSVEDRECAHVCRVHLEAFGCTAVVVMDANDGIEAEFGEILTMFNRKGRLRGFECSAGIAQTLADHADGHEVVGKLDADTLILPQGLGFLSAASEMAHGFSLQRIPWWGCYSAPANRMAEIAACIRANNRCVGCAEDFIIHPAFRSVTGTVKARRDAVHVWKSGREIPSEAMVSTLPSISHHRQRLILEMFASLNLS